MGEGFRTRLDRFTSNPGDFTITSPDNSMDYKKNMSPEPDEQWHDLVYNPEKEKLLDDFLAIAKEIKGKPLTQSEHYKIASLFAK